MEDRKKNCQWTKNSMYKMISKMGMMICCVLSCFFMVSCGQNDKVKALEKFANRDMAKVNVAYSKFAKDYATGISYENDAQMYVSYVNDTLLKELDAIISQVDAIETKEAEITDLKKKYRKAMKGYRKALEHCAAAAATDDAEGLQKGNEEIAAVAKDLESYNDTLRRLAKKYDLTVKEP